jgi:hemerythrin-like metal-binding protein
MPVLTCFVLVVVLRLPLMRKRQESGHAMLKFDWLASFELRVPEIDGDHHAMLDLMKAVQNAAAARNRERSELYVDRLLALTQSHFAREEAFLEVRGYPNTAKHMKYHAELFRRAVAVRQACAKIETPEAFEECCREMMSFLVDDVVRGDMELKSFLEDTGLTLPV